MNSSLPVNPILLGLFGFAANKSDLAIVFLAYYFTVIPSLIDSLSEEVYPSSIRSRESQCGTERRRRNIYSILIKLKSI